MLHHTVQQGEHISAIARQHGFSDYTTIWNHPDNAQLRDLRDDPHVLLPGDRLFIPERQERKESAATDQLLTFKLSGQPLILRVVLKEANFDPIDNTSADLHVASAKHEVTTDASGKFEQSIPKTAQRAKLMFKNQDQPFDVLVPMQIGHLDPITETSGQKARLNNLGYFPGPLDGDGDDPQQFPSAVEEFQCDHDLTVTGVCDLDTQTKLKEVHGC